MTAACSKATNVLVTIGASGGGVVEALVADAMIATPARTATASFAGPVALPMSFGVALPDVSALVSVTLHATMLDGGTQVASGMIESVPHRQVVLALTLDGVGASDGGDGGDLSLANDLAGADLSPVVHAWQSPPLSPAPAARTSARMVYDSARGVDVLFGGRDQNGPMNDTWELGASGWTQRTPATSPGARWGFAAAYDSARHVTVLFAGATPGADDGETWEYDGSNWSKRTTAHAPGARHSGAMAYDSTRHVCVLFGGIGGSTQLGDTWEYDGNDWTKMTPTASPPTLNAQDMVYDAARRRVVMFGGKGPSSQTWEYDGTTWTHETPAHAPPARRSAALVFDDVRNRAVLFGGNAEGGGGAGSIDLGDSWEYDGSDWTQIMLSGPSARRSPAAAFDEARGRLVLFGGSQGANTRVPVADTWTY
ncbi:MAG TPA: kelch repeat-containing protein [Polyangia bacterium]|nr:kelch repeat-containing protein [Polyangia bacterium]